MTSFVIIYLSFQKSLPISTLAVSGEAEKEIIPNDINISFRLEKKANKTEMAKTNEEIDKEAKDIVNYLISKDVKSENIKTNKNSYPDYNKENNTDNQILAVDFQVEIKDFPNKKDGFNEIWQELINKKTTNLVQNNYSLDNQEKNKICDELQIQATKSANQKATNQLKALGGGNIIRKQIQNLDNSCGENYIFPYMNGRDMPAVMPSTMEGSTGAEPNEQNQNNITTQPGSQKLIAKVQLVIEYR